MDNSFEVVKVEDLTHHPKYLSIYQEDQLIEKSVRIESIDRNTQK